MKFFKSKKELALENLAQIKKLIGNLTLYNLKVGKLLKKNRDKGYYRELGFSSFKALCKSSHISFDYSTILSFIKTYEVLCIDHRFKPEFLAEKYTFGKLYRLARSIMKNKPDIDTKQVKLLLQVSPKMSIPSYYNYLIRVLVYNETDYKTKGKKGISWTKKRLNRTKIEDFIVNILRDRQRYTSEENDLYAKLDQAIDFINNLK